MREKRLRGKAKAGRQMGVQFREGETSEVRYAGQRTLNGVAEEKNTASDFHTALFPRRQLCGPSCVLFMQSRHKKVIRIKAVHAVAQLFIKHRNVS